MLRSLYRSVLRLHPPGFRRRFGAEMLSIFDQATGVGASFRLLTDAWLSLARQWALRWEFWDGDSAAQAPAERAPVFLTLDPFRHGTAAVIHGVVLSALVFAATCFAIRYSWIHVLHVRIPEVQSEPQSEAAPEAPSEITPRAHAESAEVSQSTSPENRGLRDAVVAHAAGNALVAPAQPFHGAVTQPVTQGSPQTGFVNKNNPGTMGPSLADGRALANTQASLAPQRRPNPQDAAVAVAGTKDEGTAVNAAVRHRVIESAISNLEEHYVDRSVVGQMASALRSHEANGNDGPATGGDVFARLLTRQLRAVNPDKHLEVIYRQETLPAHPGEPTPAELAQYRKVLQGRNCDFEKVKILPGNIGYLKLNSFADFSICGSTAAAAMASLNSAHAVIFDLRDNHGGEPEMVARIAAYLFDHPEYWYNPRENTSRESWTKSPVPGNKLADKPVYVLTSHSTYSGAEQFCYDLKMLKRATLIGETTGGAAHAGAFYRIDDHFGIAVPEVRPINPYTTPGWAETGVEPDVKVSAGDSLKTAVSLAKSKLQTRR
jgi:hypothetical protein